MSFETARLDLVQAAEAARAAWDAWPLIVSYENQVLLDVPTTEQPYVCVEIHSMDSEQADLADRPRVKEWGQVLIIAHAPHNTGSRQAKLLLDHFRPFFELKNFSLVRTRTARGGPPYPAKGWECWPMVVPFWYHRLAT